MPVYRLIDEMPYDEFIKWQEYFKHQPIGWREDDRTVKIMQSFGAKITGDKVFHSLATMQDTYAEREKLESDAVKNAKKIRSLKNSLLFSKMLSAKGGEKVLGEA